ncbi:hypothetical protein LZ31DRAFT_629338 [Colletotrichum somersetense]|nr:hypothetical protein LZ31DRAFT_629338 [Colletotrichum somersetense]
MESKHSQVFDKPETDELPAPPQRYCFRVRLEEIPGVSLGRSITLANDFVSKNFQRDFTWDKDYVYTPHNIDGVGKQWIFFDVDVDTSPKPIYEDVRLHVYRVSVVGNEFNYTTAHYSDIRRYTSIFPWGGRK